MAKSDPNLLTVKNPCSMEKMRLALVIGSPYSSHRLGTSLRQGEHGLRANVEIDDFQAKWSSFDTVTDLPDFRGIQEIFIIFSSLPGIMP